MRRLAHALHCHDHRRRNSRPGLAAARESAERSTGAARYEAGG
jgi:hypothetical protein